jgi:Ca2+/Na+ antiporter
MNEFTRKHFSSSILELILIAMAIALGVIGIMANRTVEPKHLIVAGVILLCWAGLLAAFKGVTILTRGFTSRKQIG